jgi:hypothetical protein
MSKKYEDYAALLSTIKTLVVKFNCDDSSHNNVTFNVITYADGVFTLSLNHGPLTVNEQIEFAAIFENCSFDTIVEFNEAKLIVTDARLHNIVADWHTINASFNMHDNFTILP